MIRWGLGIVAGFVVLVAAAWSAGWNSALPEPPPKRQPTEAERIIAYCKDVDHKKSPLCSVDPNDPDAVRDAVRGILERQTTGPQIIERERETVRVDDDEDDNASPPRVEVNVPRSEPTREPSPTQTTRPPMMIPEVPDELIPDIPEPPNLGLSLLP